MRKSKKITAKMVRGLLDYNPETGDFYWLKHRGTVTSGTKAGCVNKAIGYVQIGVNLVRYYGHRLAWLHYYGEWPANEIDHVNGDRADNRISNLREATSGQNKLNKGARSDNLCGLKGAYLHAPGKWRARIKANGIITDLGCYNSPEEAHRAYCKAALKLHGEFARTS